MKRLSVAALLISSSAFAAAYKIPEQSFMSVGTAAAYFSSARFADTAYYNPSAMSFLDDKKFTELGLRAIFLDKIHFQGQAVDPVAKRFVISNAESKDELFLIPQFHFVSSSFLDGKARVGLSFTTPAGLSKRWTSQLQMATAEEFTMEVYEVDTSASYKLLDNFAIGLTGRFIYGRGKIKYRFYNQFANNYLYRIRMKGDTPIKTGWAVSATYKPTENLTFASLYRSKVDLDVDGTVDGELHIPSKIDLNTIYPSSGNVSIPLPAELRLGVSYKRNKTIYEFTFERTFWSSYKKLDFNFSNPALEAILGQPKPKNWRDTNTYRFDIQHRYNDKTLLMVGLAYDETPIPQKPLGFELPDSNGYILSVGSLYSLKKNMDIGFSALYVKKFDRKVNNKNIRGKFSNLQAYIFNISMLYKF